MVMPQGIPDHLDRLVLREMMEFQVGQEVQVSQVLVELQDQMQHTAHVHHASPEVEPLLRMQVSMQHHLRHSAVTNHRLEVARHFTLETATRIWSVPEVDQMEVTKNQSEVAEEVTKNFAKLSTSKRLSWKHE
ncbi:hypothetical protein KIN20_024544 [Parelaphostrongylus tenuis]|uniref:Uncharacterized protein n=1 Tax=Parelaphostrongylus tenuis TaxID=148309 RepID=A0AAD5NB89_PARTN|nr:hypothetical protein KIN20_024544 [Parelaphostrongylus tenuis]